MSGLIRFRWIALGFLLLGIIPLLKWGYLQGRDLPYFAAVLLLLATFNILSYGIWPKTQVAQQKHLLINLLVDLLAAVGLLFVSGSATNPFVSILCVHAFLGGMLLKRKHSAVFALALLVLLALLQIETFLDARITLGVDHANLSLSLLSQWILISASWFVSHYFSALLQKNEERIRILQDRQHQADRLKSLGALTAGFSHQLATPLNTLKLRLERGVRKLANQEIQIAQDELLRAQTSLEESLKVFKHMASVFSRSEEAEPQIVELRQLVQELLEVWKKENQAVVEGHFGDEPVPCRLQPLSFAQTFFDLLNNAQEASPEGSTIYVRLYRRENEIVLQVIDRGTGITDEILSRLGEPFVTSKEHGNGLGLYSAMMMAQSAGGYFKIYKNVGDAGSTAQMSLPIEEAP